MIEETIAIDVTQWLTKPFDKEYPEAARNSEWTDDGRLVSKFRSPIDVLFDRGSINADQFRAARVIIKTRQAINNNLKTDQILHEYLGHEFSANVMGPGMLLAAAMTHLKPRHTQMIDRVCLQRQRQDYGYQERALTDQDKLWIAKCCGTLRDALDIVKINIDRTLKVDKTDVRL